MNYTEKYHMHKKTVFRIAYSYMGNVQDAEDVMQNVFLKLMESGKEFPTDEDEKRWLIRITINLCLNEKRKFWNRFRQSLEEAEEICFTAEEKEVQDAVKALKPKYQAVVYLHYMEGYSITETAQILGIGESAAKMRLKRARETLRLELAEGESKNFLKEGSVML